MQVESSPNVDQSIPARKEITDKDRENILKIVTGPEFESIIKLYENLMHDYAFDALSKDEARVHYACCKQFLLKMTSFRDLHSE